MDILELGYNVMYNDVDMVWLQDPFQYLDGSHDAYFMDDLTEVCEHIHTSTFSHVCKFTVLFYSVFILVPRLSL